ncbi:PREDICTED: kelch domain-containing protein 7A [Gekko japonicus]|uniref:Kelch domain-containing protein 7A n=1 Tax=Gekko japonicus TaxID=146911 RepID=A0ABM1K2W1_GEKJA|nr:PREDICTED: kelch domain-containing protein 7A [Gekko japonicus]
MTNGGEGSGDQPPEMQLAGRLALSAAALLLLTLAYKYYRSRVSAGSVGGDGVRTDAGKAAGQREQLACDGAVREAVGQELRHRNVFSEGAKANGGPADPNMPRGRPAAVGESRLQYAPVGREVKFLNGKEEKEEGKQREEMSHLGTGSQPDKKQSPLETEAAVEKEEETAGTVLSYASRAGTADGLAATRPRGRLTSLGLLSQGCCGIGSSDSDHRGPCLKADLCPGPRDEQAGRDPPPPPPNGNRSPIGKEKGPVLGDDMSQNSAQVPEVQVGQERIQSFHATSDMGLAINQFSGRSSTAYTFSSVAKVQVEENFIKERQLKESSCREPSLSGSGLRGKVYDYYVQSVSQSVLDERPSHRTGVTRALGSPPPSDPPHEPEARLCQEAAQNPAVEDEETRTTLKEGPAPSSVALFPEDHANATQQVDPEETNKEASGFQQPPGTGHGFSRKESFHQIAENPDLQVQMEGFGARASGKSGCSAPDISSIRSHSVSSLIGSMQSLEADATVEPTVKLLAGARFFHVPLDSDSSIDVHLDLGNCYEVLCMAKKQKLERVQEAAYKVMSENYLQVLRTHAIYGRLNALERDLILQRRMRGKKYVVVADISSQDHSHGASRLCYYDDQGDTWHPLAHVPMEAVSRGCAVCNMFNYLFVVAGCEGRGKNQKPSNRVFCYNPLTNIWREICPLNQARPHCKLVALDGSLYAIGGECLYTVERYDPRMDRWTFAAPLPNDTFAVAHTATVCDGEIYVTGGTLRYMLLRYISRSDTWKISLTGGSKDRTTEMVTINGFIYRFDLNRSMGISVYRCSAKAKLWYECATHPMPFPACFQCAVVDNLVYCISRQFNIRFLADYVSPRFGTKELQNFPSPRGTLFPTTLVLPDRGAAQTRV